MNCPHRPVCPGCPLAERPYSEQLVAKQARLSQALSHFPYLPQPQPIIGSAWQESYRHRLKLPVQVSRDHVAIGLYDGQHRVLNTPDCPVLAEGLRKALPPLMRWLTGRTAVHSVDLRLSHANGSLQLVLACQGGELHGGRRTLETLRQAVPHLRSIAISTADSQGKRVMGRAPQVVHGDPTIEEAIGDTKYDLLPGAFFQVDPRQAAVLHELVAKAVGPAQTLLDLYAGVGAYALRLAPGRRRVLAVEEVPQAAEAARRRAPANVEVRACRVEDLTLEEPFDAAILNPARRGADPVVLARVARLATRLVMVSCGPETLARDLDVLAAHGMHATKIQPIDLFPQTPEVETVVVLERGTPRKRFSVNGGSAQSPWGGKISGALGQPNEVIALLLGRVGNNEKVHGATVIPLGTVATHTLCKLVLDGPMELPLSILAKRGHGVAGQEPRTAKFFAEKAGLVRPFLHVLRAGKAVAPLHGDLAITLLTLGAPPSLLAAINTGRPPAMTVPTKRPPRGNRRGPRNDRGRKR